MNKKTKVRFIVGIDEVGRGPLAGPVAIGVVAMANSMYSRYQKSFFIEVKDSKKLTLEKREEWCKKIIQEKKNGNLDYKVSFVSHKMIDKTGLSKCIKLAIKRSLNKLNLNPNECRVLLDGGIKAPVEFEFQETIIKGDEKIPIISLASIVAKVKRDRKLCLLAKKYPNYGFEIHKGYGTKFHRDAIKKFGVCEIHRMSFLKNFS
ncbi:MAG: ribonuclease HII [Candidatus Paceibacterota bacterium]